MEMGLVSSNVNVFGVTILPCYHWQPHIQNDPTYDVKKSDTLIRCEQVDPPLVDFRPPYTAVDPIGRLCFCSVPFGKTLIAFGDFCNDCKRDKEDCG